MRQPVPGDFLPAGSGFRLPGAFNNQLGQWLAKVDARLVRRTGPPLGPARCGQSGHADVATGSTSRVRLPKDLLRPNGIHDYSVHPQAIGRFVDANANLGSVTISSDGRSVGTHPESWGAGLTIQRPEPR